MGRRHGGRRVQALRQQIEIIKARIAALDTTAKLLVGSLLVVLAMGLFLVAQYAGTQDLVPLAVSTTAKTEVLKFLAERGITHEQQGEQILVPPDQRPTIISQLTEQGVGGSNAIDFNALIALETPFDTARTNEGRRQTALQNVLNRTFAGYRGVKSASVLISSRPGSSIGTGAASHSASVSIVMKGGETLTQSQVDAIASTVAGSQAGLKPENVAISDGERQLKSRSGRDHLAGENLEHQQNVAEAVRERVMALLPNIPGAVVSVNPQVVTKTVQETETKYSEGVSTPLSDSRVESSTKSGAQAGAPGVATNTGMAVNGGGNNGNSTTSEKSDTKFEARIPGMQRSQFDPTGYPLKIDVSVAIPWSYFKRVWELRNAKPTADGAAPATAAAPDEAAINAIRDEEIIRLKKSIEPLIATDAIENSKKGTVEVTWFYDFDGVYSGGNASIGGGAAAVIDAISPGTSIGGMVKTVALGALAVLALGMMLSMVKKASERPELPSAEELSGVPPALETDEADIVGEADESAPALEGVELDDESLRREQMLTQINGFVKREPLEAAGLLKRWMRETED
jgi:flagellar M-ring protein FliF